MHNEWIVWGHEFDEYRSMYDLSDEDLKGRLLEFGYGLKPQNRVNGHYLQINDGTIPFEDFSFDLALSSNHLFVKSDEQSIDAYLHVLKALARVAKEVRIFPIGHEGVLSPLLGPVLLGLQQANYGVEVRQVSYPEKSRGNAMLRIWAQECQVG